MHHVTVLIVNYRAAGLVLENLPGLTAEKQGVGRLDIIVVENGSGDDSAEVLAAGIEAQGAGARAELIVSEVNGGFAAGNNVGFRAIYEREDMPDYVLLLNPDTRMPEGGIAALVEAADAHPEAGGFGGRALREDGALAPCAYRFPSLEREVALMPLMSKVLPRRWSQNEVHAEGSEPVACDWVSGSCFLIRREALDEVPLFDDGYFLYFEETDYCQQLKRLGWEIMHVPTARYVHIGGQSTGLIGGAARQGDLPAYWYDSWRRYFVRNHGRGYALLAGGAKMLGIFLRRLVGKAPPPGTVREGTFWKRCIVPTLKGEPL